MRAGFVFDPTSGLLAGEGHIPLACTPEPSTAAPVSGLVEESKVEFEHTMKIERVWEAPASPNRTPKRSGPRSKNSGMTSMPTSQSSMSGSPWAANRIRLDRRSRRRRMEHGRAGARQAPAVDRPVQAPETGIRPHGAGSLWPGQMVPGRAAAALVAQLFLAPRWGADLASAGIVFRREGRLRGEPRHRATLPSGCRGTPRTFTHVCVRRLRKARLSRHRRWQLRECPGDSQTEIC